MEVKLCPYCMQVTFGDFCTNCNTKVDYQEKPMQLPVGTKLQGYHHYLVGAALGQGGFGVTYLALDTDTNRKVALKEFYPVHCSGRSHGTTMMAFNGKDEDFEKGKHRFLREAQTLQRLAKVESVVKVYDCFQDNNTVYLAMEFVEGQSLKSYLDDHGPFEPENFFPLIKPLLEDVAEMHRQGVIHRDIAPDNIILATDGRLRLIDFGTAREYMGGASMTVVVKKGFAPVEQYTRKGQGAATDVYALAATIYYCITGQLVPDSMDRFDEDTLKRPSELGVKLPRNQENALIHALGVRVKERTQTVDAFLAELFPQKEVPKPVLQLIPESEPKPISRSVPMPEPKPVPKPISKTVRTPEPKLMPKPIPKKETKPKQAPVAKNKPPKKKKNIWIGIVAVIALAVVGILFAVSGEKKVPEVQAEPEMTAVATEEAQLEPVPVRNVSNYKYAYSDNPKDSSCYTAEEFAELVNYNNVREYLPLGTRIKMLPNSPEISDESIEFELVAYKHFRLADGSDMAKTTWLAVNLLNEIRQMNPGSSNENGWAGCKLRSWLNESLYPTLPDYWKAMMQSVQVRSTAGEGSYEIVTSNDYLFIPSAGEVDSKRLNGEYIGEIDDAAEEKTFSCFTDNTSRVKSSNGTVVYWWLRSPYPSSTSFYTISTGGASYTGNGAGYGFGVCVGFCLGGGREMEDWISTDAPKKRVADDQGTKTKAVKRSPNTTPAIRDVSSYAYAYSDDPADNACYTAEEFAQIVKSENVRDLLPLGTRIKMLPNSPEISDESIEFELVAYKHFRLADGSDMAKTTWLAVNLLNETRQMNTHSTNQGGWSESELRKWLNNNLYSKLPDYWKAMMQSVQVRSTAGEVSNEIVTSNDYLFIPSAGEVNSWLLNGAYSGEIDDAAEEKTFSCFNNTSRKKSSNGTVAIWWLRSPYPSSTYFYGIYANGSANTNASASLGVCVGFCI